MGTEEQELVHFIKECTRVGYARTRSQIIAIVEQVLKVKHGLDTSELTIRTAEKLAYARAVAQNQSTLSHYTSTYWKKRCW